MDDPLVNKTLGGCQILEVIGQGGMGVIYRARQLSLDRIVAVKLLSPRLVNDITFVARFQREARAVAKVNHPNILAVYDVGSENDSYFMVMELVEGQSLGEMQARMGTPFRAEEALNYIRQAARGLEAAHATGLTHRDIKPENLMLTKKGVVKVSDFGLAKESDSSSTSTDAVMGTPAFMSPEQCDGRRVDCRSDIYALGGTFYKLVTNRLPFEAETAMSMMYRHKHEALVPPREICISVPRGVSEVIRKMMEKRPEQRYQSMTEVIAALDHAETARDEGSSRTAQVLRRPERVSGRTAQVPQVAEPAPEPVPAPPPPRDASAIFPPPGLIPLPHGPGQPAKEAADGQAAGTAVRAGGRSVSSVRATPPGFQTGSDPVALLRRGEELIARGDRSGGLKLFSQALQTGLLDPLSQARVEEELRAEVQTRRQAGENLFRRGLLMEASREFRLLLDLDPSNEEIRVLLKKIDDKLVAKRTLTNDVRAALAALQFEQALNLWDRALPELRDEGLAKQIEQLRNVVLPSLKLCEQGEQCNTAGRLEEALATFEDALRMDPNCERAKQGASEVNTKLRRIESLLKEGFEASVRQEYGRAIQVWRPILQLQPRHPQALKYIVDSYLALIQDHRGQGALKAALKACEEAAEADPENRSLARLHEELANLHDKEEALIGRANEALAKRRTRKAIYYWREVLRVNPHNETAQARYHGLRRERRRRLMWRLAALVLLVCAILGGWQYALEHLALRDAEELRRVRSFQKARQRLGGVDFFFMRAGKESKLRELHRTEQRQAAVQLRDEAEEQLKQRQWQKAAESFNRAAEKFEAAAEEHRIAEPVEGSNLQLEAFKARLRSRLATAEEAITKREWPQARRALQEAQARAEELRQVQPEHLEFLSLFRSLLERAEAGHRAALERQKAVAEGRADLERERRAEVLRHYRELERALVETEKENRRLAVLTPRQLFGPSVHQAFVELGYSPSKCKELLAAAGKALSEPWRLQALQEALTALEAAREADPNHEGLKTYWDFAQDAKHCAERGMVLHNRARPEDPARMSWTAEDRRERAWCIDRYEYPNQHGETPKVEVPLLEAQRLCLLQGKKLCGWEQWRSSCQAKEFFLWPFGNDLKEKACNWRSGKLQSSGSFPECRNQIGAYDMSGNAAEWTLSENGRDGIVAGGSFRSEPESARCTDAVSNVTFQSSPEVGFRCCKPLPAGD